MICKECGKFHDGIYGSGKFCSAHCARKFSTKFSKNKTKTIICNECGKEFIVPINSGRKKCNNCFIPKKKILKTTICKICGQKVCANPEICGNRKRNSSRLKFFDTLVKYFNFDKTTIGTINVYKEFYKIKDILYKDYYDDELSYYDIRKKYNLPETSNNINFLKKFGIIKRSFTNTSKIAYLKGKIPTVSSDRFKHGWHTTWNNKQVYLRSSYEFDYAKELDEQKIDYEVEYFRIKYWDNQKYSYRCAIPDFYLKDSNTIVEIKSDYTYNEQNMKDKFTEYKKLGFNTKLILEHKEINL